MKIVINKCFGGFGLSPQGYKRFLELEGKKAYFFKDELVDGSAKHVPMDTEPTRKEYSFSVFTIPNPDEYLKRDKTWWEMSDEEKDAWNQKYEKIHVSGRDIERSDPKLVQVVEELGIEASGRFSELKIIEIPDSIDYEINEYDGMESVHEVHRSWD